MSWGWSWAAPRPTDGGSLRGTKSCLFIDDSQSSWAFGSLRFCSVVPKAILPIIAIKRTYFWGRPIEIIQSNLLPIIAIKRTYFWVRPIEIIQSNLLEKKCTKNFFYQRNI